RLSLAAYYVLLLDLNCLFRAAASAAAVGTSDAEDKEFSDNLIGRLCSWLASPAWDLCLALPYCIYLCIQFAVCEQHPAASQPDSGDCGAIFSAKADGGAVKVGAAIDNSADANIGAGQVGAKLIGAAGDVSIGARGGESDANGETREPWLGAILSRQTQLRQQLSAPAPAPAQRQRSLEEALQLLRRDGGSVAGCLSNADYLNLMQAGHVKPRQLEGLTGCPNRVVGYAGLHLAGTWCLLLHPCNRALLRRGDRLGNAATRTGRASASERHGAPAASRHHGGLPGGLVLRARRGCRASVYRDGMTRAPLLEFPSAVQAVRCMQFAESEAGQTLAASAL
uniref:Calpain catalytic domain-containing protein n=1 Tax=Macrostomum lignano TaxID=282301 RepID=A0A1I8FAF9_9PLAT